MSTGGNDQTIPPPTTHPGVKAASVAGVVAFVMAIWSVASPLLPKSTKDVVQPILQKVVDNQDQIQKLIDEVDALRAAIPKKTDPPQVVTPVVTPIVTPTPLPVVSPEIQQLQDQVKRLTDLINQQNQPPAPVPVTPVVQVPTPPLPSAIKAVDAQGKPVSGTIDPGQQFFVQATASGGTWTIIKSADQDVDAKVYADEVSCVLRNGATITIVHSSGLPITTSSLIVKCNKGAQPPPGPTPVVTVDPVKPVPVVPPAVVPGSKKFSLYVVEDPAVVRSLTTATILNNLTIRKSLTDKGHSFAATTLAANDSASQYIKQQSVALPALAVFDVQQQQFVKAAPLPTDLGLSLITSLGG